MKQYISIGFTAFILIITGCSNRQNNSKTGTTLSATEFANKIKEQPTAPIVDVRTPEEFGNGHLTNSLNYDWNGDEFDQQIATLDRTKPVFVYCLSGGRSSLAAAKMRASGFNQVYEMDGGIMKWRTANLPETTATTSISSAISPQQFEILINTDKLVIIDFYADWCAPCKKMKPYLEEISKDMADKVIVIPINADNNQALCKELAIDAVPVLHLYKNKKLIWSHTGFIDKESVVKQLH